MSMEQEAYGRHIIKSWPRGHLWQARAYIGDVAIGDAAVEQDRQSAIANLKARLDVREAKLIAGKGTDGSPSAIEYAEAFGRLQAAGKINRSYQAMLDAHLNANDHAMTATELARAAGYKNFNAVNLHYGRLGELLSRELGWLPRRRGNGDPVWTAVIADGKDDATVEDLDRAMQRREHDEHYEWVMRDQVVQALKSLQRT